MKRKATDYTYTASGKRIYLPEMKPSDVDFTDIAFALGQLYRFNGHSPITVARHSLALSRWVLADTGNEKAALLALLHDMPEAYVMDVPIPLQRYMKRTWKTLERRVMACITKRVGVSFTMKERGIVHRFDKWIVQYEMNNSHEMKYPGRVNIPNLGSLHDFYDWDSDDRQICETLLAEVSWLVSRMD